MLHYMLTQQHRAKSVDIPLIAAGTAAAVCPAPLLKSSTKGANRFQTFPPLGALHAALCAERCHRYRWLFLNPTLLLQTFTSPTAEQQSYSTAPIPDQCTMTSSDSNMSSSNNTPPQAGVYDYEDVVRPGRAEVFDTIYTKLTSIPRSHRRTVVSSPKSTSHKRCRHHQAPSTTVCRQRSEVPGHDELYLACYGASSQSLAGVLITNGNTSPQASTESSLTRTPTSVAMPPSTNISDNSLDCNGGDV